MIAFRSLGETDPKERLARQRKQLQKKLGLDMGAAIGMDTEELFNDEDLEDACASSTNRTQPGKSLSCHFSRNHMVSCAVNILPSSYSTKF